MTLNSHALKNLIVFGCCLFFLSCKREKKKEALPISVTETSSIDYASGFDIQASGDLTIISVSSPWPNANESYKYALIPKEKLAVITLNKDEFDAIIPVPVKSIVVTSTTHIPSLESLGVLDKLTGFPGTDFISSSKARKRIDSKQIKELGNNEAINTEMVIELQPDVLIGFGINDQNKAYNTIQKAKIPVVYNGEWTEKSPLGKAEWIKFFAPFFRMEKKADSLFEQIETNYLKAKELVKASTKKPTVLTGGLYKDVWHVAGGDSWMSQFIKDAGGQYLWDDNADSGGLSLSIESVLAKGQNADFWLNPSMLTTYKDVQSANAHYTQFDAFANKKIFANTLATGETGGLLFYELAPNRPDLVLKDLIHIFHPELLPNHQLFFFKPLN